MEPLSRKIKSAEMRIMINGLNFASHATMMAVKPLPPAVLVEMVWLAPDTARKPAMPHSAPEINMVRVMTLGTLMAA